MSHRGSARRGHAGPSAESTSETAGRGIIPRTSTRPESESRNQPHITAAALSARVAKVRRVAEAHGIEYAAAWAAANYMLAPNEVRAWLRETTA